MIVNFLCDLNLCDLLCIFAGLSLKHQWHSLLMVGIHLLAALHLVHHRLCMWQSHRRDIHPGHAPRTVLLTLYPHPTPAIPAAIRNWASKSSARGPPVLWKTSLCLQISLLGPVRISQSSLARFWKHCENQTTERRILTPKFPFPDRQKCTLLSHALPSLNWFTRASLMRIDLFKPPPIHPRCPLKVVRPCMTISIWNRMASHPYLLQSQSWPFRYLLDPTVEQTTIH